MDRQGLVFLAKLSEEAERYDEMVERVTALATSATDDLTIEERNLLSVAYKNATGTRRASWRIVSAVQKQQRASSPKYFPELTSALRSSIEDELTAIGTGLTDLIDKTLLPLAASPESKLYYLKMKGDYARYMAEYVVDTTANMRIVDDAKRYYQQAHDIAMVELAPTHYLRLGLALNYSVFHYDILRDVTSACKMAKQAFDDAIAELDTLTDELYRDSALVMQLLRDNIALWMSDNNEDEDVVGEDA